MPPASLISLTKKLMACDCSGNSGSPAKPIWSDNALRLATGNTTLIDVAVRPRVLVATWLKAWVVDVDATGAAVVPAPADTFPAVDLPPPPPDAATTTTTTIKAMTTIPTAACVATGRRRNRRHARRVVAPTLLPAIQTPLCRGRDRIG